VASNRTVRDKGATAVEIEALYRARSHVFLYTVTAFLRDGEAAADVVQDGFALALGRRDSFRGEASVETWVWQIVLNVARDRERWRRRQPRTVTLDQAGERMAEPAAGDDLDASLVTLPERQRLAVFLRYYADMSYGQIADALGVRTGTVAASLHAAHAALRQQLEEVAG